MSKRANIVYPVLSTPAEIHWQQTHALNHGDPEGDDFYKYMRQGTLTCRRNLARVMVAAELASKLVRDGEEALLGVFEGQEGAHIEMLNEPKLDVEVVHSTAEYLKLMVTRLLAMKCITSNEASAATDFHHSPDIAQEDSALFAVHALSQHVNADLARIIAVTDSYAPGKRVVAQRIKKSLEKMKLPTDPVVQIHSPEELIAQHQLSLNENQQKLLRVLKATRWERVLHWLDQRRFAPIPYPMQSQDTQMLVVEEGGSGMNGGGGWSPPSQSLN